MQSWLRVAMLGLLCVALSSGLRPWIEAVKGAFMPADIAQDIAAAKMFVEGVNPYGPAIRERHAPLIGLPLAATFPHFPHPPFSLIVSLPLAFTTFPAGAALWFGFTLALVFLLAVLLEASSARTIGWWRFMLLLLIWPPVLYNIEKGQWSVLLAVLLALAWRSVQRGDVRGAAVWGSVAAAVKVFPVVLGAYFLLRSRRAAVLFAATGALLTALPLAWIGIDAFPAFVRESRSNMAQWDSYPLVMFSIHGAITRLFVGGRWAVPIVHAPLTAMILESAVLLTILGLAVWVTILANRRQAEPVLAFCAWVILLPLINPQSLGHNGVLLALPVVYLFNLFSEGGRKWYGWAWAAAVVLISIPKQTVWRLATPPVSPVEGLAVASLPTFGALLLFVLTIAVARDRAVVPGATAVRPVVW